MVGPVPYVAPTHRATVPQRVSDLTLDGLPHPLRYLRAWAIARLGAVARWGELLRRAR